MRRIKIFTIALFLIAAFIMPQTAFALGIEAAIGGWSQDPSGDISYKGQSLDVGNDLKYGSKTKAMGRVKIDMPLLIPNIYLMYTPMKFDGDGSKNVNFTFGNRTFSGNVPFSSSVKLDHYDLGLYYGIPFVNTATAKKLNVDAGLNIRVIDFNAEVKQPATGITESKGLTIPLPMVYVAAQFKPIKYFAAEAEARGIAYSSNHYYDLIGRLKVKPIDNVFVAGGYRYENIKIDQSSVKANLKFSGPFFEAGIEF